MGCRLAGRDPLESPSGQKEIVDRSKQLNPDSNIPNHEELHDSDKEDTPEMLAEDTGMVWKVVKRVPAVGSPPAEESILSTEPQPAEPMDIDSVSGDDRGRSVTKSSVQEPRSILEKEELEGITPYANKLEDAEKKDGSSGQPVMKADSQTSKAPPNSGIQTTTVESKSSLVIEIGGYATNLNGPALSAEALTKHDCSLSKNAASSSEVSIVDPEGAKSMDLTKEEGFQDEQNTQKVGIGGKQSQSIAPGHARRDPLRPEYLVKWAGRSHIHNEWVSEDKLRLVAKRKLENYKAKYGTAPLVIMEDQWSQPQRILARRSGKSGSMEVLVKWHGLSYDECTWEGVNDPIIVQNLELVHAYDRFEAEALAGLSKNGRENCRPPDIEALTEQPEWLKGGVLFPHQLEALNWLRKSWHRHRNVILADEMGLGKTISACAFLSSLSCEFNVRTPCLVLVPLSTMPNWQAEFSLWAPSLNVIEYHGSVKARAVIREHEWYATPSSGSRHDGKQNVLQPFKFNVMLTTYEMVIADSSQLRAVPWEVLIVDEGHRLKNSESKLFTLLNTYKFGHRVLLTGTPLQNNLGEMYNLLNFLQLQTFPSLGAFQEKFSSLSTAEQVDELKKLVAPHMLRRLKKDAMQNIPPKMERVVPVELTPVQAEYYRALLTKNYQLLRQVGGGKPGGQQQSMLNIMMQLRKVCNHPYLLVGSEPEGGSPKFLQEMRIKASAKLTLLHSMLQTLKKAGHRVLIFSQMTKLLDILEDYLSYEFGQASFERVDGSVPVAERQTAIARFNQDPSRFVFLLSTRSCGLGINLATADTVIIYDSDFNPHADIQAMNRAHRIGQSKTLLVYRMVVRASVEERILQLAKKKLMLDHLFASKSGSQKDVEDIIRWGTEELFMEGRSLQPESLPEEEEAEVAASGEAILKSTEGLRKGSDGSTELVGKETAEIDIGNAEAKRSKKETRVKVVWDEAAVARLLDRSELGGSNLEVAEGEQESDWLGSLKVGRSYPCISRRLKLSLICHKENLVLHHLQAAFYLGCHRPQSQVELYSASSSVGCDTSLP